MDYSLFLKEKANNKVIHSGFKVNDLNHKLFDWQKEIVDWCLSNGKSSIFAACGLGKTPMQLEWAYQVYKYTGDNVLILAPLAVTHQTKKEGKKFDIDVNICRSQFDIKSGINITNYEMVDNFHINKFSGIVLDESSILKNLIGKFRNKLIGMFRNTPFKLCCTA